jgi:lipopolysaccharide transport system ATP-binding protein
MSNTAIKVENLSKIYRLGEIGTGTISRDMERWFRTKVLKQEDPFLKIGETNDRAYKGSSDIVYSLRNINFEINQGDAVGIIGRNGAGKSTLLKILSRVTTPSTGKINIKGRVASLLEVGTGFHPELTGRENIYLNGAILGMRKKEIDRKLDEIIDFSGVERYIDTPVKRYSSGMYVRLAFAVAAHLESEILIVDEVLAVGDAEFQKKCLGKMGEVSKGEGRTVLFVSHNMGSISQLCKNAILLNSGKLETWGSVKMVTDAYISRHNEVKKYYEIENVDFRNKRNYFSKIYLKNAKGLITNDFAFDECVNVNFEFFVQKNMPDLKVGIVLQNEYYNRVTSFVKSIELFKSSEGIFYGSFLMPKSIIAPGNYSFSFALFSKDDEVFDLINEVCNFQVHDNGTDFTELAGIDTGSVILKVSWH